MKTLHSIEEVSSMILAGKSLMLAGDEKLLSRLPKGNWIAGTIPYFMSEKGGVVTHNEIQVIELPSFVQDAKARFYGPKELPNIPSDYAANGVSMIIIPAFSEAHRVFAQDCSTFRGVFDRPLVGWISGVDLKDLGKVTPKVMNGQTGEISDSRAIVLHVSLPQGKYGKVNIVNLFSQGNGDVITFPETGFTVSDCMVNGKRRNFAEYIKEKGINTQLPLVANYNGAMINASFQSVNEAQRSVALYAPVFPLVEYRIAAPVADYERNFNAEIAKESGSPVFTCNCILNFLYANLEGKKTGQITGPITFGEIAYMLLNQTMVYLTFEDL